MSFSSQMTQDESVFFNPDEFAVTVTYNGSVIPAHVFYGEAPERGSNAHASVAKLKVLKSDVAAPAYKDPVVIDSVTWKVDRVLSGDGFTWMVEIRTDERKALK